MIKMQLNVFDWHNVDSFTLLYALAVDAPSRAYDPIYGIKVQSLKKIMKREI